MFSKYFRTFDLSFPFFLVNPNPYGPVTTKRKDLLISGDTFSVVESRLNGELMTIGIFNGDRVITFKWGIQSAFLGSIHR